jgi:hypothetical protein
MDLDIDQEGILGYGNDDCRFIYVPILKNAHTTYRNFFAGKYGMDTEYRINHFSVKNSLKDKRFIIILRDPIERWVSGAVECFYRKPEKLDDAFMLDLIFKAVGFDEHVGKQIDYLYYIDDITKCFFFYQSVNLHKNICTFCSKYLVEISNDYQYKEHNVAIETPGKKDLIEKLNFLIESNTSYKTNLKNYYTEDIALVNDLLTKGRNWQYTKRDVKLVPAYRRLNFYGTN